MSQRQSFRARYVFPVDSPPLERGIVEIEGDTIVAVHDRPDGQAIDCGNVAFIPGLVNAHAHLEFSDLDRPIEPPRPFTKWLQGVIGNRSSRTMPIEEALQRGANEVLAQGTAVVGEIATQGWSARAVAEANASTPRLHVVSFREAIALSPERISSQLDAWEQHRRDCAAFDTIDPGISPHAPYSVHPKLFEAAIDEAKKHRLPLAIHLAETEEELELLQTGGGEFREFLTELGVWRDDIFDTPRTPLDYLRLLAEVERGLVVHGNYLSDADADFLAQRPHLAVVYCPRTHAYFGHPPHPWRRFLDRGVSLALGTDGRSSNPDLSLWNELRYLREHHPDVPPATLLRLGTIDGANALGVADDYGSLTPGKKAAIAVVEIAPRAQGTPEEKLLAAKNRMLGFLNYAEV